LKGSDHHTLIVAMTDNDIKMLAKGCEQNAYNKRLESLGEELDRLTSLIKNADWKAIESKVVMK